MDPKDWKTVRSAFIRLRKELNRTQQEVAAEGGLPQSAISKLESNDNLGPAAAVFLRAIKGLGLKPSAFFLQIENQAHGNDGSGQKEIAHATLNSSVRSITKPSAPIAEADHDLPVPGTLSSDAYAVQLAVSRALIELGGKLHPGVPASRTDRKVSPTAKTQSRHGRRRA